MKLQFARNQYLMSKTFSQYPYLGFIISRIFGTTNIGQFARANIFKSIIGKLSIQNCKNILDIGCGQGEYSFMLARAIPSAQILALDIEPKRINSINRIIQTKNIKNLKTHLGYIDSIKEKTRFDFIYSIDVFEHIHEDDMPFDLTYKLLNKKGMFLVKIPSRDQSGILPSKWFYDHNIWLEREHIGQVYMLKDLVKRMQVAGFEVIYKSYGDGILSRLSWELSYLSKKVNPLFQIALLPFLKFLVILDRILFYHKKGNTIQVVGQKL